MVDRTHHRVRATAWRERAKRLAGNLLDDPVRDSLLEYSEELEEKATKLEALLTSARARTSHRRSKGRAPALSTA
jgi:hypothetical protein